MVAMENVDSCFKVKTLCRKQTGCYTGMLHLGVQGR